MKHYFTSFLILSFALFSWSCSSNDDPQNNSQTDTPTHTNTTQNNASNNRMTNGHTHNQTANSQNNHTTNNASTNAQTTTNNATTNGASGEFKFIVFGDFNGGGCERNDRVQKIIDEMAKEEDIAFYVSTGDLIDGYGETSCFATEPTNECTIKGSVKNMMQKIKERPPVPGLSATFFPVIGNHDDNWGSGWYPDPCGDGICDFLAPLTPDTYINHAHGDICSKNHDTSVHSDGFYYSFAYKNAYFIILNINNDYDTLLSSCNGHADCVAYCSDPSLFGDAIREDQCYNDNGQYKWYLEELEKSKAYPNVFVFSHAVALAGGDGHVAYSGSEKIRDDAEKAGVDLYFSGHNHAYHRTGQIRGESIVDGGTMYITTGVAGAALNYTEADWYTAKINDWVDVGLSHHEEQNAAYVVVTIKDGKIEGIVKAPFFPDAPVDTFEIGE